MKPLAELPASERSAVSLLLADVDDTITTDGRITSMALRALEDAKDAGLKIVLVTGRSAGWCEHIARAWPVDAVIGENGGFHFRMDRGEGRIVHSYMQDRAERRKNWATYEQVAVEICRTVPGTAIASDQAYRETDLAIDVGEDVGQLPWPFVEKVMEMMRAKGLTTSVSSLHVNGWLGAHDKRLAAEVLLKDRFGVDLADPASLVTVAFVGDSLNDQALFERFPLSIGVANVTAWADRLKTTPAYVSDGEKGAGFAEVVGAILAAPR